MRNDRFYKLRRFSRKKTNNKLKKNTSLNSSQNEYSLGDLLSDVGNQEIQNLFESGLVQARLNINQSGDIYEQEADKIADNIVNANTKQALKINQLKGKSGRNNLSVNSNTESKIKGLKGRGNPLNRSIKEYFEPRFGIDLENIRIHTDTNANQLANSINAKAFTYGNDIVFGKGQFQPNTTYGKKLIAHELVHTQQQDKNIQRYIIQRVVDHGNISNANGVYDSQTRIYTVANNDWLSCIARRFEVTAGAIARENNIAINATIILGQQLTIPDTDRSSSTCASGTFDPNTREYTVHSGDTLISIALRFRVTVDAVRHWNNLNSNVIEVNQVLEMPMPTISIPEDNGPRDHARGNYDAYSRTYRVVGGDIFNHIAARFNTDVEQLQATNGLTDTEIHNIDVNQLLLICGPERPGDLNFLRPTAGRITFEFGRRYPDTQWYRDRGLANRPHRGLDFGGNIGDRISASENGIVVVVNPNDTGSYGRYIIIDHGRNQQDVNIKTLYAHLNAISSRIQVNRWVVKGERIGDLGESGDADGAHLHFEVREDDTRVDPEPYI